MLSTFYGRQSDNLRSFEYAGLLLAAALCGRCQL